MVVIRPGAVSEVGQGGDILLAFAAMQETGTGSRHSEMPARGRASMQHNTHAKTSPVIPGWLRNDGEEEEK